MQLRSLKFLQNPDLTFLKDDFFKIFTYAD